MEGPLDVSSPLLSHCEGATLGLPLLLFHALFAQAPRFRFAEVVLRPEPKGTEVARPHAWPGALKETMRFGMVVGLAQSIAFVTAMAVAVGSNQLFCQLGRCAMGALLTHTIFGTRCAFT